MNFMRVKALAKINLGLDVTGVRETDGYHMVRMIMQTIDLYDWVTIEKTKKPGIKLETNLNFLPLDEHNIAYKAAALLQEHPFRSSKARGREEKKYEHVLLSRRLPSAYQQFYRKLYHER